MAKSSGGSKRLIASVGATRYDKCSYQLGSRVYENATNFAVVALAGLKRLRGADAHILLTEDARQMWWELLSAELTELGLHPQPVHIPKGCNEEEVSHIIEAITSLVNPGDEVFLDVTLGFRHLPFIYLASLVYLVGLRQAKLGGIYYGAREMRTGTDVPVPIVDITSIFRLVEWYHALQTFHETGDLRMLASQLDAYAHQNSGEDRDAAPLRAVASAASRLALSTATGLPLEMGLDARATWEAIGHFKSEATQNSSPLVRLALERLQPLLERWLTPVVENKKDIPPTRDELTRLLDIAEWFLDKQDIPKFLIIAREWLTSAILAAWSAAWLDRGARGRAENWLRGAMARSEISLVTDAERKVLELHNRVNARRNQLAHAGFEANTIRPSPGSLKSIIGDFRAFLASGLNIPRPPAGGGTLLVTPLGKSPGAVYTALKQISPEEILVVASKDTSPRLGEILAMAGTPDLQRRVIELVDPYTGFNEIRQDLDGWISVRLVEAGQVIANVTGGTSAMQYAVERIAERSRELGAKTRTMALVDRRPYEEQQANPYVIGEVLWLPESRRLR